LLHEQRDALDRLARALLERETLDEQEIIKVTGIRPAPRSAEAPVAAMPAAAFSGARPTA
jgi:cell division protease FtsH